MRPFRSFFFVRFYQATCLAQTDEVEQSVVDNVTKILDAGEALPIDADFLSRREAELVREVRNAAFRMKHYYDQREQLMAQLVEIQGKIENTQIDNFLRD